MRTRRKKDFNQKFLWGILAMSIIVITLVLLFTEWAFQGAAQP